MLKRLTIGMMLLIMLVTPAAATSGYLVPADSSVANPGDTVDVAVWVSVDDPNGCTGGTITITYCDMCADAIAYTPAPAGTWAMNTCVHTAGQEVITLMTTPPQSGDLLVGTFTVECKSPGDCLTPIEFDESSALGNGTMGQIPDVEWIDGTFTCGTPTTDCLGDCYNDTGVLVASDVPCYDCIGALGVVWENYEFDSPCSPGTTVPRRSYDYCPECCDAIDNDGDTLVDWSADPECACCLDETEAVDEGCPVECVPELPTLALAGIGILGIALLARKRD